MSESTEGTPTRARQIEIDKEARLSALQAENTKLKARVSELEKQKTQLINNYQELDQEIQPEIMAKNTSLQSRIDKAVALCKSDCGDEGFETCYSLLRILAALTGKSDQ